MPPEIDEKAVQAAVAELVGHCKREHLPLPSAAPGLFGAYLRLLLQWKERMSLTGAETPRELALAHVLDSLHVAPELAAGEAVADLGSGAGFPGIPLAIARPDCSFALVEARRKRATFLRHVARELRLANVRVEEARAEELARTQSGTFDVVVARAVADLATLARFAYPLLKCGGRLIAMKGPNPDDELRKRPHPSWPMRIERYRLPEGLGERTLVILWTNGRERAG